MALLTFKNRISDISNLFTYFVMLYFHYIYVLLKRETIRDFIPARYLSFEFLQISFTHFVKFLWLLLITHTHTHTHTYIYMRDRGEGKGNYHFRRDSGSEEGGVLTNKRILKRKKIYITKMSAADAGRKKSNFFFRRSMFLAKDT